MKGYWSRWALTVYRANVRVWGLNLLKPHETLGIEPLGSCQNYGPF